TPRCSSRRRRAPDPRPGTLARSKLPSRSAWRAARARMGSGSPQLKTSLARPPEELVLALVERGAAAHHEEPVAEAVQVAEQHGALGLVAVEAHELALGSPADRARLMAQGRGHAATRQDE